MLKKEQVLTALSNWETPAFYHGGPLHSTNYSCVKAGRGL